MSTKRSNELPRGALSDSELERLRKFLAKIGNPDALTPEGMDGLFCALIAGPELVSPSEYMPVVFGGELSDESAFESLEEANALLSLMMRHWNAIVAELETDGVYEMLLDEPDANGVHGRRWARGFMRGVAMRKAGWLKLFADENEGQLASIPMVAGEIDPKFPATPLSEEKAEQLVLYMGAGLGRAYRHFKQQRRTVQPESSTFRRDGAKTGRNDPCPCGSGAKFKKCCGAGGSEELH